MKACTHLVVQAEHLHGGDVVPAQVLRGQGHEGRDALRGRTGGYVGPTALFDALQ